MVRRRGEDRLLLAATVDELLATIETRAVALESRLPQRARHLAAAGLLHCCSLLRGIRGVGLSGVPYVSAVLIRQLYETYVIALNLALRGEAAVEDILADDIYWKRRFPETVYRVESYHPEWTGKPSKLNVKELADRLPALLKEKGESRDPALPSGYDVFYRVHSLFGTHAGLSTLGQYIVYGPDAWSLALRPSAPFPLVEQTPALLTAHLAKYVFQPFEIPVPELEPIAARLHAAIEA